MHLQSLLWSLLVSLRPMTINEDNTSSLSIPVPAQVNPLSIPPTTQKFKWNTKKSKIAGLKSVTRFYPVVSLCSSKPICKACSSNLLGCQCRWFITSYTITKISLKTNLFDGHLELFALARLLLGKTEGAMVLMRDIRSQTSGWRCRRNRRSSANIQWCNDCWQRHRELNGLAKVASVQSQLLKAAETAGDKEIGKCAWV